MFKIYDSAKQPFTVSTYQLLIKANSQTEILLDIEIDKAGWFWQKRRCNRGLRELYPSLKYRYFHRVLVRSLWNECYNRVGVLIDALHPGQLHILLYWITLLYNLCERDTVHIVLLCNGYTYLDETAIFRNDENKVWISRHNLQTLNFVKIINRKDHQYHAGSIHQDSLLFYKLGTTTCC